MHVILGGGFPVIVGPEASCGGTPTFFAVAAIFVNSPAQTEMAFLTFKLDLYSDLLKRGRYLGLPEILKINLK